MNSLSTLRMDFGDRNISYEKFMDDLATRIVSLIKETKEDPPIISQRKAFTMFGKCNVLRWEKTGKVTARRRPGRTEYNTAELRKCQTTVQDYF
jgi:hypothetical protein